MNSTKSKLNVKLLRKIQKHILEEPKRLYMAWFIEKGIPGASFKGDGEKEQKFASCGTAACIAGWAILFSGKEAEADRDGYTATARSLLGISQTGTVFLSDEWPQPFRDKYRNATSQRGRAKIAAARIEHLITTGE